MSLQRARLSVIIPCLDVETVLPTQLEALAAQQCSAPWEVIVVDNGSTDRTCEVAEGFRAQLPILRIIEAPQRGRHHACNAGAAQAVGDYLVFVDADDEVAPGFVIAMTNALERHPLAAGRLDHTRLNAIDQVTVGAVQTDGLMQGFGFLPYASGGCLGVRREAFLRIGGFAEDKDYCEDVDFSWRAQLNGFEIRFVPEAVVSVRQRSTLRQMRHQHRNFGAAQALLFRHYRKHGMHRRRVLEAARDWLSIVKSIPMLRTAEERQRWIRRLGRAEGRLVGSFRHGVFYL